MSSTSIPWGPTGQVVYDRTYSRPKSDGSRETWPETVERVVNGNFSLVYGRREDWTSAVEEEAFDFKQYMLDFALIPAGRQLWASGVEGRQFLFNCHVSGWGKKFSEHFEFTFLRLMEGGGVGANYSTKHIKRFGAPQREVEVIVTSRPDHKDIEELSPFLGENYTVFPWVVEDSREGWADAMVYLINSAYEPGEKITLVFDVSNVRPSGSELKTFGGTASGPAPFARMLHETARILNKSRANGVMKPTDAMEIDHAIAECVVSGGTRRSARMSIVAWDDPYIDEFLACKQDTGLHWTTNISVEIDNRFVSLLKLGDGGTLQDVYQAKAVHRMVCQNMLENGEPGYWNSDLSNEGEEGLIIATNPCGEIPLEAWEACNLGHVNMDYFHDQPKPSLEYAHRLMGRFLVRSTFGDISSPIQKAIQDKNRRIGVGHLGVQGYWAKQGVRYSQSYKTEWIINELQRLYDIVRIETRDYARSLGIPVPVKVTTVAPTGSVAKLPGVTEGIHPIYARYFEQRVRFSMRDARQANTVLEAMEAGFAMEIDSYDASGQTAIVVYPTENILVSQCRDLGLPESIVEAADEIDIRDMLGVQAMYQRFWADNAVSYTINVPEGKYSEDELALVLTDYLQDIKGTTLMVDASRPQAPFTRISAREYELATAKSVEDSTDLSCASGACPVK